ncbi:MAG: hypothetical protein IPN29_07275 [Saprospiraceae bacterium]|nr:hypothetical protein [Saprospiraceae bacterium]
MNPYIKSFLTLFLLVLVSKSVSQIEITLSGRQPYPVLAENYIEDFDVISATIRNTTSQGIGLKMFATINGPYGLKIESRDPSCMVDIGGNITRTFRRGNYRDLCLEFNISDVDYGSLTTEQKNALILGGLLPEGNYTYCLIAKDENTNEILNTSCLEFEINFPDRPTLLSPIHQSTIDGTIKQFFNVTWSHVITDNVLRFSTKYNVKIVDLSQNGNDWPSIQDATILLDDANVVPFYLENDVTSTHPVQIYDLPFLNGRFYAVRITAYSDDFPYPPESSQSNIVIFKFIEPDLDCGISFQLQPEYPTANSWMPFKSIVPSIHYDPYCDEYEYFSYETEIRENGILIEEFDRSLNWINGPKEFFQRKTGIEDPESFYSSRIAVGDYQNMPALMHGREYSFVTKGRMEHNSGKKFTYNTGLIQFNYGMPKVKLTYPVGGQVLSPGNVSFTTIHDQVPESPLPPFKLKQIIGKETYEYPSLEVEEMAVLQVSKSILFDTIVYAAQRQINAIDDQYVLSDTRKYDMPRFVSDVYSDFEFNRVFEDNITYFWRLAWAKIPSSMNSPMATYTTDESQFYNISDIDSFKISNSVSGPGTGTPNPDLSGNSDNAQCKSMCEIPPVTNTTDFSGSLSDETIKVGQFNMEILEIEKSGNTYSGEGLIEIPFIRKVKLKTVFQNIKVNTDKTVYQGTVAGKDSGNELETLNTLLLGQNMELPFGWDTTIQNIHLTLGITSVTFQPTNAFMQLTMDINDVLSLLHESDNYPILSAEVCFQPGGYERDVYLYHQNNITLDENDSGYGFEFKGGQSLADTTGMTYVKWTCNGFTEFQLGGAVTFSQSILLKDSGNISDDNPINQRVKGHFTFKYNKLHQDFMITARMEDFQFANHLPGWGFDTDTIFIDFSDHSNPPNFEIPEGYNQAYLNNPATANAWKGVYVPKAKVLSSEGFAVENFRATFGYSTMLFGDGIYYLRHRAFNVVNEGIIGRLTATIDTIDGVISNIDFSYKMNGRILMPFAEEGAFLKYSGLYDDLSNWNLLVKVGNDSIVTPLFMSHLTLYENSLISYTRDAANNKPIFKFLLNGHISADDKLMNNSYIKKLKSVKMLRIEFQDMAYETGKGFTNQPIFRKASPAKSLNGFPIQIDSIALTTHQGNPGLYIKPKLVLSGEEDGFSVAAGLIFYSEMSLSGAKDEFFNPNAYLSDISIDVARAGCRIKGEIKFIEEGEDNGIEGTVEATMPSGIEGYFKAKFGNVGSNTGLPFNTAGYYTYWYVDAMLSFGSSGVPIFSGINLYGLGGGLWHNMKQDTLHNVNVSNLMAPSATSSGNVQNSGIPYSRHFGGGYGFRLKGLFGDPANGEKFNMLLTVEATFPEAGGPIVKLRGDVYLMSKMQSINADGIVEENNKALWGFAEIQYNGQEHFIDAEVEMRLRIKVDDKIILQGIGPGSRMVHAKFHAKTKDENYWYLLVGTPDERGGIKLDVKVKKASAAGYLMFGYGIPVEIPEPDAEFMSMLNNKKENYTSNSGDPNSILNREIELDGYGIAFGAVVKDSFKFDYQPFYLVVKVILGFDFNITKNGERKCVETGITPGYEDWYGTGQLYAGISGEFGIHVDLWFIEGDYPIFYGSIAALMSGGLPNPSWFYCRGTMNYQVLGFIEGSHSFELTIGQKCTLGNGNPFGDGDVIIDTKPKEGDQDVSVFVLPTVSYAFPINETLAFYDEKIKKYREFKLLIDQIKLTEASHNYNPDTNFDNDNYISFHKPNQYLKARTNHKLEVKVKAKEKRANGWGYIKEGNTNVDWEEKKTINFKTGSKPDSIDPKQLEFTYPLQQQRFFLKDETVNNLGIIRLNNVDEALFYKKHPVTNLDYHYVVLFTSLSNGDAVIKEKANTDDNRNITFKTDRLQPSTVYRVNLMRVKGLYSNSPYAMAIPNLTYATYSTTAFNRREEGLFNYNILPARMVTLGSAASASTEKSLFQFHFRTSQYDNLEDKLEGLTWKEPKYAVTDFLEDIHHEAINPVESFDVFEMEGFQTNTQSLESMTHKGLIRYGTYYLPSGQEIYEETPFQYLGNDAVIVSNNPIYFEVPTAARDYHSALLSHIRSTASTSAYNLLKMQLDNIILKELDYKIRVNKLVEQYYNATLGPFQLPQSNNGIAIQGVGTFETSTSPNLPPQKKLRISIKYGTEYFLVKFNNSSHLADYLSYAGNYLRNNNQSLYNQISSYVNTPSAGTIWHCQDAKYGIIYRFPWIGGIQTGSKITRQYATPGPCAPNID